MGSLFAIYVFSINQRHTLSIAQVE